MKTGIGHDTHRFQLEVPKNLVLGGFTIPDCFGLQGNSDGDVVLHALTNALSSITGVNILGAVADEMCMKKGIKDSKKYLKKALGCLKEYAVVHVSISIEAKIPKLAPHIDAMKESIASLFSLTPSDVGITATSGERLTAYGRGEGIMAIAVVTAIKTEK
ncbi:MAG: 2-C-methyl-D-erythritol 2,4-cyclodiphosphate synthase [Chitinivibrionales bacterium]|nr:2-C-methyl-D-erythritol 2,4-cyclodiphosphate synthase [Chitinivibrionales bacterium]